MTICRSSNLLIFFIASTLWCSLKVFGLENQNFHLLGDEDSETHKLAHKIRHDSGARKASEYVNDRLKLLNEQTGSDIIPPDMRNGALFLFLSPTPSQSATLGVAEAPSASATPSATATSSSSVTPSYSSTPSPKQSKIAYPKPIQSPVPSGTTTTSPTLRASREASATWPLCPIQNLWLSSAAILEVWDPSQRTQIFTNTILAE